MQTQVQRPSRRQRVGDGLCVDLHVVGKIDNKRIAGLVDPDFV